MTRGARLLIAHCLHLGRAAWGGGGKNQTRIHYTVPSVTKEGAARSSKCIAAALAARCCSCTHAYLFSYVQSCSRVVFSLVLLHHFTPSIFFRYCMHFSLLHFHSLALFHSFAHTLSLLHSFTHPLPHFNVYSNCALVPHTLMHSHFCCP